MGKLFSWIQNCTSVDWVRQRMCICVLFGYQLNEFGGFGWSEWVFPFSAKINLLKGLGPDLFVRAMGCPHIWINVILDCTCEVVSGWDWISRLSKEHRLPSEMLVGIIHLWRSWIEQKGRGKMNFPSVWAWTSIFSALAYWFLGLQNQTGSYTVGSSGSQGLNSD